MSRGTRPDFTVVDARSRDLPPGSAGRALVVADSTGAQEAVLAALRGEDLVLHFTADDEVVDRLLDDLTRLGEVRWLEPAPDALTEEQVALLARLHAGMTLGEAAGDLHVSRRTADRRLAAARQALGVGTTAEALVAAARQRLLPG